MEDFRIDSLLESLKKKFKYDSQSMYIDTKDGAICPFCGKLLKSVKSEQYAACDCDAYQDAIKTMKNFDKSIASLEKNKMEFLQKIEMTSCITSAKNNLGHYNEIINEIKKEESLMLEISRGEF